MYYEQSALDSLCRECTEAVKGKQIAIVKGVPFEVLDGFALKMCENLGLTTMPRGIAFRRAMPKSKCWTSANGENFASAPIVPHNEGDMTGNIRVGMFWVEKMECRGGQNILSANHACDRYDAIISGENYITRSTETMNPARSTGPPFPYNTTFFDKDVYNEFVNFLVERGLNPDGNEISTFEEYLEIMLKNKDFPLSACTRNFNNDRGRAVLRQLFEQSTVIQSEARDLIIFDNTAFTHARPPFVGNRKLWACFLVPHVSVSISSLKMAIRLLFAELRRRCLSRALPDVLRTGGVKKSL